jgi:2-polyprenyl-6-methoxyphenol hydroxylase-like FAD-dependent oxidoreductase
MLLKSAAKPQDVDGKSYDLVVIGGTPGGIACAVRAAREGLSVLLVNHTQHLGGFVTSGAGGWEAPYDGLRSPIYGEMITGAAQYYAKTYGEGSPQHIVSMPSKTSRAHIDRPKIEPRIAEMLFNEMVENEKTLTVLLGHIVTKAERDGALIKSVTLKPMHGESTITVSGKVFADGMYEGDLMAAAGVKTQIGRESRAQYGEKHAGVIYTQERHKEPGQRGFPKAADEGTLNIRYNSHATADIVEGPQSGEADGSVMAYNYRLVLTRDPANRIMVTKPANYDVAIAKASRWRWIRAESAEQEGRLEWRTPHRPAERVSRRRLAHARGHFKALPRWHAHAPLVGAKRSRSAGEGSQAVRELRPRRR